MTLDRILTTAAITLALAVALPGDARAGTTSYGSAKTYDVCGGSYSGYSGFGLCASVAVNVYRDNTTGKYFLTMTVYNESGSNGSYSGSVFTRVGLDNVLVGTTNVNALANTLVVTGPCAADPTQQCNYSSDWAVSNDKTAGGGINVDLLSSTARGVNSSIASSCITNSQTPATGNIITTSCTGTAPYYATFTFEITAPFDPSSTGALYIMAQNGYNGQSTYCSTGVSADCTNMAVAPEPMTLALVGTGLGAIGGIGIVRRRRRDEDDDESPTDAA